MTTFREDTAQMHDYSRMHGNSQMYGNSHMYGNSRMFDNSQMYGNSQMHGNSHMYDSSHMCGNSHMYDSSHMCDNSQMHGNSHMYGNSLLSHDAATRYKHILRDQWLFAPILTINRSDGYTFAYWPNLDGVWMITAGCRYFDIGAAHDHWRQTRGGTPLGVETLFILKSLEQWRLSIGQELWDNRPEMPEPRT